MTKLTIKIEAKTDAAALRVLKVLHNLMVFGESGATDGSPLFREHYEADYEEEDGVGFGVAKVERTEVAQVPT